MKSWKPTTEPSGCGAFASYLVGALTACIATAFVEFFSFNLAEGFYYQYFSSQSKPVVFAAFYILLAVVQIVIVVWLNRRLRSQGRYGFGRGFVMGLALMTLLNVGCSGFMFIG